MAFKTTHIKDESLPQHPDPEPNVNVHVWEQVAS